MSKSIAIAPGVAEFQVATDITPLVRVGWGLVLVFLGGFLAWSSLAPLDKGVPLSGTVTVESSRKAIQHEAGGTVEAILVKDGDVVKAGDELLRMNAIRSQSDSASVQGQYLTALAAQSRLEAELSGARQVEFPEELRTAASEDAVAELLGTQRSLFVSRRQALQSELASIDENAAGLEAQIRAMEQAHKGKLQQQGFLKEQLDSVRELAKDGFAPRARLLEAEQAHAQISAALAEDEGVLARSRRQVAELRERRSQRMQEDRKEISGQLADVRRDVGSLRSRLPALERNLANEVVRAPVDGTVMGLAVFSKGAVVAPGARLMDVVPSADPLVVEGRLPVHLVDKVHPGLDVELLFSAFDRNKTPNVPGRLEQLSADRFVDERSGEPYYKVLVRVTSDGMRELGGAKPRAGMPVDLFVKTGERTLMSYLMKPLVDHFHLSLTED